MKALYTLVILLIPFVGFGQDYQEIIIDSSTNTLSMAGRYDRTVEILNDGYLVAGENRLEKFDFNGNIIFSANCNVRFKPTIKLSSDNKIIVAGEKLQQYWDGVKDLLFEEFTNFGGLLTSGSILAQDYNPMNNNFVNDYGLLFNFKKDIIELEDDYLVISKVDSNTYQQLYDMFIGVIGYELLESFDYNAIKISKDWNSREFINISNNIFNSEFFDSTRVLKHYFDENNNHIYFLNRKIDYLYPDYYIFKTNLNLEILDEIYLNLNSDFFETFDYINNLNFKYSNDNNILLYFERNNNETLSTDIFIQKYNLNGDLLWENYFGGYNDDYICQTIELSNGNIIISAKFGPQQIGGNDNRFAFLTLNSNGDLANELYFEIDYPNSTYEIIHDIKQYNDSYVALIEFNSITRLLVFENSNSSEIKENFINNKAFKTYNLLGKKSPLIKNQPLIKIYDDGSVEKVLIIE